MTAFQAWLFLGATVVSIIGAGCGIWSSHRTAKQQATLNFINGYNNDPRVPEGHAVLRMDGGKMPGDILAKESRIKFLFLMNKFEILAIGLNRGIYDEIMVLDTFGRDIREIYQKSKPLIAHIRGSESDAEAFLEFEKLAGKIETGVRIW